MKKIIILICMIFVPAIVFGATMCAKNNTLVVALDSSVGGSTYTQDNANSKWTTTFTYGIVKGVSACTSFSGGSQGNTTKNEIARGERNGQYCWCRLTHPVSSLWAFDRDRGSASNCASNCTGGCGVYVQNYVALRAGLFGSVAPDAN